MGIRKHIGNVEVAANEVDEALTNSQSAAIGAGVAVPATYLAMKALDKHNADKAKKEGETKDDSPEQVGG
jgi:hypothetical protein